MSTTMETAHEDMVHDSQFDYYGSKLATASSDQPSLMLHNDLAARSRRLFGFTLPDCLEH